MDGPLRLSRGATSSWSVFILESRHTRTLDEPEKASPGHTIRKQFGGLIDPACYHGHTEVDLAMLGLFDQPVAAFYDAYGLLAPGHDERTAIYRLWPAIVHMRLFGAGYRPMVERLLQATGT